MFVYQTDLVFLDETDEGRPLDLDRLTGSIVESDDKVEKVGLSQVGGRLLLEMGSAHARGNPAKIKEMIFYA